MFWVHLFDLIGHYYGEKRSCVSSKGCKAQQPSGSLPEFRTLPLVPPCIIVMTSPGLFMVGDSIGVEVALIVNEPNPNILHASLYSVPITLGCPVSSLCSAMRAISTSISLRCVQVSSQLPGFCRLMPLRF